MKNNMQTKHIYSDKYLAFMGLAPKRIPHWEHMSNPDAESYITGIDYYSHPKQCRLEMKRLWPDLDLPVPEDDAPKESPADILEGNSSVEAADGQRAVRWGDSFTGHWVRGRQFKTAEDVYAFSPVEQGDFREMSVVENHDYSDEEALYRRFRARYPEKWGDKAPDGSVAAFGFYNTMFMWPLLTFGWEMFLETCLDERFAPLMEGFAELNRRVFRSAARLPVNFVVCHDDIVTSRGPVCSPEWMRRYVFPKYEEYWDILKKSGKRVLFMADGNMDRYADDVMAYGASGIISEPYTDYKLLAKKHKDCFLAGEGDNRILSTGDRGLIRKMVDSMVDTAKTCGGYFMCVGNHIPWNVPPEAVGYYLEYSREKAVRE